MAIEKVVFIVPLFNHLQQTQEMFCSLLASLPNALDYEVIFVDDASTDGTLEWLKMLNDSRVRWLANESNRGYAFSINRGFGLAKAEYICLLNNDLLFDSGWLEPMLEVYQFGLRDVGMVGNVQYRIADGQLDHAGILLNPNAKFDHVRTLDESYLTTKIVLAVTGACVLLRKDDFLAVGGFDEEFINGAEDLDLCFKLRSLGKEIYLAGGSQIRHHVSLTRGKVRAQDELNSRRLFSKWRSQIKTLLTSVWHDKLSSGSKVFGGLLDGQLSPEFLTDRELAANVIAESFLSREEAHWLRLFGHFESYLETPELCAVEGLLPDFTTGQSKLRERVVFTFSNVSRSANFFVCGRSTANCEKYPLMLIVNVNDIQTTVSVLDSGSTVNIGIQNPIILCGKLNRFEIKVVAMNPRAQRFDGIENDIVISHVVFDDRTYPIA